LYARQAAVMRRLSLFQLICIAHLAFSVRVVGYTLMPAAWLVIFLEPLHGVTFACYQMVCMRMVERERVLPFS